MAKAFPKSKFVGFDYHADSIEAARGRAADAGVADRVRFEVARRRTSRARLRPRLRSSTACTTWAIRSARRVTCLDALAPDGTWLIVEPFATTTSRTTSTRSAASSTAPRRCVCTPASLSQEVGLALGAQAGEARLRDVVTAGGFTRFRRATETPFNLVLEARP